MVLDHLNFRETLETTENSKKNSKILTSQNENKLRIDS